MSNPTRDPHKQTREADQLQRQRHRLQQAWAAGASLEETAALMHSVLRLLPAGAGKKRRPLPAVSVADRPVLRRPQR
jgi:hypothetical protein